MMMMVVPDVSMLSTVLSIRLLALSRYLVRRSPLVIPVKRPYDSYNDNNNNNDSNDDSDNNDDSSSNDDDSNDSNDINDDDDNNDDDDDTKTG